MIVDGQRVKVHYEGKLDDGTPFDSSNGRDPLEYEAGARQVIPGFEQAVNEMEIGETKTFKVPSQDAFGEVYQELVATLARTQIPPDIEPREGMTLTLETNQGEVPVRVTDVTDESVTVDGNHPLAGQDLNFTVTLVEVV